MSEAATQPSMLAMSIAPAAPHHLPRFDMTESLSVFSPDIMLPMGPTPAGTRPKLSLKTFDLNPSLSGSTCSRSSINLSNTTTPTTSNTFTNAFDLTYRPSPVSTLSPGAHFQHRTNSHSSSPATKSSERPYKLVLPFGIYPILKNTPLPRDSRRPSTCSAGTSPRIASRRLFFPLPKKVAFRAVLEEEIVTKDYIMHHTDLSSSDDELSSSEIEEPSVETVGKEEQRKANAIHVDEYSPRGRRKLRTANVSKLSPGDTRGRDGVSRRTSSRRTRRRSKRWEWTLETTRVLQSEDVQGNHASQSKDPPGCGGEGVDCGGADSAE